MEAVEFGKVRLTPSQSSARQLLGRLIVRLRKEQHFKLFVALDGVVECDIVDNILHLIVEDHTKFEVLTDNYDYELLRSEVDGISNGTGLEIEYRASHKCDSTSLAVYLKKEFGKILTIKGDK